IRRILASTALAGVLGVTAITGVSALDLGDIFPGAKFATDAITRACCKTIRAALHTLNSIKRGRIANENTTRNELVQNLRQASGTQGNISGIAKLAITKYSGQVADRAVECNIVKPNPELPFGSSELNSLLNDYGPQLFELSSEALSSQS